MSTSQNLDRVTEDDISVPEVHRRAIIVDGHCDSPYRMHRHGNSLSDADPKAQLDLDTLERSGITASFFVSYVPPFYAGRGSARFAHELIDLIHREIERHPDKLDLVVDSAGVRRAKQQGRVGIMIGVEGGHAIEDSLDILNALYQRGARYLTLTHVNTNNWADSSADVARHHGLTPFGREVVRTMNDLGMIVDVSHVSDETFYHALEASRVPIIASHSSCRALTNHPRNLTDSMLRDLATADGLCMINFFSAFINEQIAQTLIKAQKRPNMKRTLGDSEELPDDRIDWEDYCQWFASLACPRATIDDAVDHIEHAVEVAGVDHVGIGSDFDGVPDLPLGLGDAARLPMVTQILLDRGFSDEDILKILGENFLRVFGEIERGVRT